MSEETSHVETEDSLEGQPEYEESLEASEVEASTSEDEAEQPTSPEDSVETQSQNWWDTSGLQESEAKRIKSIQAEYTRKSQELSRFKDELEQAKTQLNSVTGEIKQALLSPDYKDRIEVARKQVMSSMGMADMGNGQMEEEAPPKPGKWETQEDILEYIDKRDQWKEKQFQKRLNAEISKVAQPIAQQKWQAADQEMKTHPVYGEIYQKYSNKVYHV